MVVGGGGWQPGALLSGKPIVAIDVRLSQFLALLPVFGAPFQQVWDSSILVNLYPQEEKAAKRGGGTKAGQRSNNAFEAKIRAQHSGASQQW